MLSFTYLWGKKPIFKAVCRVFLQQCAAEKQIVKIVITSAGSPSPKAY